MSEQMGNQERREVSGFHSLRFMGMGKVALTQGDHEELVIDAQPEIRQRITTEVRDGVLIVDYDEDWKDWSGIRALSGDKIVFNLVMREIKSLALSGVGGLDCARINCDTLDLSVNGPGLITVGTVQCNGLKLSISGVGAIDIAGTATDLGVNISGAGTVRASRLEAESGVVKLAGVGTATVWVKNSLDASISGAGVIEYYGNPQINEHNSGLGMLKYLGKR